MPGPVIDRDTAMTLLGPLTDLVARAGAAILSVDRQSMTVEGKADGSPVTEADLAADAVLAEGLARLAPDLVAVSEERCAVVSSPVLTARRRSFCLIDPLDGTKEFVAGRDEFTVNLALVTDGEPLLGIVGAPALGLIWRGVVGRGAERVTVSRDGHVGGATPIRTRARPIEGPWVAAVSRSHGDTRTEAFIASHPRVVRRPTGSAVKFCQVAEGSADVYPRLAPTCEWDIAAGHAVLVAAGGLVTDSAGRSLRYGETSGDFIVAEFIAWGDPAGAPRG